MASGRATGETPVVPVGRGEKLEGLSLKARAEVAPQSSQQSQSSQLSQKTLSPAGWEGTLKTNGIELHFAIRVKGAIADVSDKPSKTLSPIPDFL